MPKVRNHKLLVKAFRKLGCEPTKKWKGSHHYRYSPRIEDVFEICGHANKDIPIKTVLTIIKKSGYKKEELDEILD